MIPSMQPAIPDQMLGPLVEVRTEKVYRADKGGQYVDGDEQHIPFRGAILPLSEEDIQRAPQGTYTAASKKLYTNGHAALIGGKVEAADGTTYTVKGELDYGSLHPLKRYIVERKDVAT